MGNKEYSVFLHLVLAIENTTFSLCAFFSTQTEHTIPQTVRTPFEAILA
jgi:hypothetical protein